MREAKKGDIAVIICPKGVVGGQHCGKIVDVLSDPYVRPGGSGWRANDVTPLDAKLHRVATKYLISIENPDRGQTEVTDEELKQAIAILQKERLSHGT